MIEAVFKLNLIAEDFKEIIKNISLQKILLIGKQINWLSVKLFLQTNIRNYFFWILWMALIGLYDELIRKRIEKSSSYSSLLTASISRFHALDW